MKTSNSSKVAAQKKCGATEVITPKSDSLYSDAGVSGIMTRSRLKRLCAGDNKEVSESTKTLHGTSECSANLRHALLRCFEDSPGTTSLASTSASSKKSQKNALLEAKSVTPSHNDSVIDESRSLRKDNSLKSDNNDKQDCTNAHKSVSVALYNASGKDNPFVTVTVSGLCDNVKAAIMIHDIKKGRDEVYDTDCKVSSLLLSSNDEQSPKHPKKDRKAIKSRKKSRSSLNENEWTVTAVSEDITECGNATDVVKFPQDPDEGPLRNTELLVGPSVSSTNDELSPNNSQKEMTIKKSRKSKSSPQNENGSTVPTAQGHITELENEMCKVKSAQKFNRTKNMWNPVVHISPITAEFEERQKSDSIRCGETPLKNSTDLGSDTNSEVSTPLSGLEPLECPLVSSNNDEPSPDYSVTERKAKKSRKRKSSLLSGNEWTVTAVSGHITAFENETGGVKSCQDSDRCSLKSTEPPDVASMTSDGDESLPSNSHKETNLQNSRKNKSLPPNKNKWTSPTVPEGTTELGNEIRKVKSPQKFDKCKNRGNPVMTISQLPIEIEECAESVVCIRKRETQFKNLSDTESALVDKACEVNKTSDSDSETRHVEGNHKGRSSPVYKSKMTKEVGSDSSESDSDAESRKAIMESAQRRIIQNISTSESESKIFVQPRTKSTGSDTSDSVPEALSFSVGRQLVMESLKNAAESIQREKHRRKEKRKQRLEKYKQQKEDKLIRLKEKRASQEDASCSSSEESGYEEANVPSVLEKSNRKAGVMWEKENLDDVSQSKGKRFHSDDEAEPKGLKDKKRKNEQKDTSQHSGNLRKLPDEVLENLPDQVPVKLQKTDTEATSKGKRSHEKCDKYGHVKDKRQAAEFRNQSDIDYIPLSTSGATEFGVMPLDKFMRAPKSMAERAAEFRQDMLFGSRIKRGPANAQAVYQHKLQASGKGRFFR